MKLLLGLVLSTVLAGCKSIPVKELSAAEQAQSDELIFALGAFHTLVLNLRGCQEQNDNLSEKYEVVADKTNAYSKIIETKLASLYGEPHVKELKNASLNMAMQKVYVRIQRKGHTKEYCDSKVEMASLETMPQLLKTIVSKYGINQ